ncbi:hypothetical protein B0O80DRAFT_429744 [Mortierella sp. GBAus27b]|nr:hypothetical protein B0O80DRAFT_429744 [Mortierella sp. GBAus27b]
MATHQILKKVKIEPFNGTSFDEQVSLWLVSLEDYYDAQETEAEERLSATPLLFQKTAKLWWQGIREAFHLNGGTWLDLKQALIARFEDPNRVQNARDGLARLRQNPDPDPDHETDTEPESDQVFFLPRSRSIDSPDHPAYQLNSLALQDPDPEPSPDEIVAALCESQGDHAPLLKIEGQVKRQPISFMIDSGANRNFLSRSKAKTLGLRLTKRLKPETVNLADSHGLLTTHYAIARVFFGKSTYQVILFDVLDMKFEAILGVNWLAYSFPRPQIDWSNYTVRIGHEILYGERADSKIPILSPTTWWTQFGGNTYTIEISTKAACGSGTM